MASSAHFVTLGKLSVLGQGEKGVWGTETLKHIRLLYQSFVLYDLWYHTVVNSIFAVFLGHNWHLNLWLWICWMDSVLCRQWWGWKESERRYNGHIEVYSLWTTSRRSLEMPHDWKWSQRSGNLCQSLLIGAASSNIKLRYIMHLQCTAKCQNPLPRLDKRFLPIVFVQYFCRTSVWPIWIQLLYYTIGCLSIKNLICCA